jgi:hypothetical protein
MQATADVRFIGDYTIIGEDVGLQKPVSLDGKP